MFENSEQLVEIRSGDKQIDREEAPVLRYNNQ